MNQLNSNPLIFTMNIFRAPMYSISEEWLSGFAAVFMAFTSTVAPAVASRFMAVPTSVWSALKWIAATPSRHEYSIPARAAASMARITISAGDVIPAELITSAPPSAPMTIIPSRPRLITPECSEIHPPRATSISTEAKISVYWIRSSIIVSPPSFHHAVSGSV